MVFRNGDVTVAEGAHFALRHRIPMLLATIVLNLLGLAMPVVILQVFERVVPTQGKETLSVLTAMLIVVFAMELALRVARARLQGEAGAAYETALYNLVYRKIIRAKPDRFLVTGSGAHLDRVQAVGTVREHRTGQRPVVLVDIVFAGAFAAGIWLISGPLVIIPLCFFGLVLALGAGMQRAHRHYLNARESVDGRRYSFFIEFLGGTRTIRTHNMEPQMLRRYELLADQTRRASFQLIGFAEIARSVAAILGQVSVVAMALGGGILVINGSIGIGTLAACMLLNGRISQPVLKVFTLWAQSESIGQAQQKIEEIISLPQRPEGRADPERLTGVLAFRDTLLIDAEGRPGNVQVLRGEYLPGDILHLVETCRGQVASLFATILGERAPLCGGVDIDGWSSERLTTIRGPGGVVYLGDEAIIFQGTILENITLFGHLPAHGNAMEIARAIGLDETVRTMPMGYETVIGAEGNKHSQGFLQLVAVARALAMRPKVLMIDNAVSALDANHCARVASVLQNQSRSRLTIVRSDRAEFSAIATHRLILREAAGSSHRTHEQWDRDLQVEREEAARLRRETA